MLNAQKAFGVKRKLMLSPSLYLSPKSQVVLACHITGVYDVNRNNTLADDDYELVRAWAESIAKANLRGIIFHNNFTEATCTRHENAHISFVRVNHHPDFNPNVFRYLVYRDFLSQWADSIESVFVTDVSDVTLINNPFEDPLFKEHPLSLFCGDEQKILDNEWMQDHSAHLRSQIKDYSDYEKSFGQETLLNCGIIGGAFPVFFEFVQKLCQLHENYNRKNPTAYTGDMGAFNYLARTQFNERLIHGSPVNTVFKMFEIERQDCWFRHK